MTTRSLTVAMLLSLASLAPTRADDPGRLTLDRILGSGEFQAEGFGPTRWLDGGKAYTTLEKGEIVRYETATGERSILIGKSDLTPRGKDRPLGIADYAWSADRSKLLIFTNTRRVWRLNTRGDYWVLDLKAKQLRKLGGDGPEASLMFAKLSPDGSKVAYVRASNVEVEDLKSGRILKLTTDGTPTLINGTFDWVYEEEWSLRDGFRWSPDGKRIAFWQIDASGLKDYVLVNTTDSLYPTLTKIPYPKVGTTNPAARIGVIPAEGGKVNWIHFPGEPRDYYLARMDWADNPESLLIQRLDRRQKEDIVWLADAATGHATKVHEERDPTWVEVQDDPVWLDGGSKFLWLSEADGFNRIHTLPRTGGTPTPISPAGVDVIQIVRIDPKAGAVDYMASPDDPTRKYLYRVALDGKTPARKLTPTGQPGTHSYDISPDGTYAFHTWSSFSSPPRIELVSLPDHRTIRTLVTNDRLREAVGKLELGPMEFFRVDNGRGVLLDGWVLKPPGFDPSKKYPLLVHVYGEPAAQTVLDRWGGRHELWHWMMAQKGYVVVSIDNHGTPAPRGRAWRKSIYKQIGVLASQDQAGAVRNLLKAWPFLDKDRVGVWGWSGGGSMTLNAMFRHPDLYKAGVAIAFISDQKLYDTIYQERYMDLPQHNPDGYRDGSPITFAQGLKGKLLLIHGTGDDNCHYQSCERLINRLVELNKPFDMMAYPNRTHSISEGPGTSKHLYGLITRYFDTHVGGGPAGPSASK